MPRKSSKWEWKTDGEYEIQPVPGFYTGEVTDQEILWRMKGYLDCLRALSLHGPPDPKYIEWLCEQAGEPLVSLTYVAELGRKLGKAAEQ